MWQSQLVAKALAVTVAPFVAAVAMASAALGAEPPAKPSDATSAPPEAAATADKPAAPKVKMICTRETETGSHQVTKVCRTQQVADDQHKQAQDLINQRRGPTSPVNLDLQRLGKQ